MVFGFALLLFGAGLVAAGAPLTGTACVIAAALVFAGAGFHQCGPSESHTMRIQFNDVEEFLGELLKDREHVERGIVRVTCRYTREYPLTLLTVIASAVVAGHVVKLTERAGSFIMDGPEQEKATKRAEQLAGRVETVAGELGLEVRHGVFDL